MAGQQTITAVVAADARPFKKSMSDAGKSTETFTKGLKFAAAGVAVAFAGIAFAVADFGLDALKAADKSRQISKGLEQAIKNSKAFGANATEIKKVTDALDEHSRKLGELTGIDDEVLSGIKRNWLSVGNIARTGTKQINKLAGVAADVAAGTGKDLETVANAFTKAYGDPKGAIAKLQKAGVILTDQEKERYQLLVDQGKETQALSLLTDILAGKFKGQAEAAASPFERIKQSFGNFQEKVGAAFLPVIDKLLPDLQKGLEKLALDPEFQASIQEIAKAMIDALPGVVDFIKKELPSAIKFLKEVADLISSFNQSTPKNVAAGQAASQAMKDAFMGTNRAQMSGSPTLGAVNQTNITINASSVNTSAATGKAVAQSLDTYFKSGGAVPAAIRRPGR